MDKLINMIRVGGQRAQGGPGMMVKEEGCLLPKEQQPTRVYAPRMKSCGLCSIISRMSSFSSLKFLLSLSRFTSPKGPKLVYLISQRVRISRTSFARFHVTFTLVPLRLVLKHLNFFTMFLHSFSILAAHSSLPAGRQQRIALSRSTSSPPQLCTYSFDFILMVSRFSLNLRSGWYSSPSRMMRSKLSQTITTFFSALRLRTVSVRSSSQMMTRREWWCSCAMSLPMNWGQDQMMDTSTMQMLFACSITSSPSDSVMLPRVFTITGQRYRRRDSSFIMPSTEGVVTVSSELPSLYSPADQDSFPLRYSQNSRLAAGESKQMSWMLLRMGRQSITSLQAEEGRKRQVGTLASLEDSSSAVSKSRSRKQLVRLQRASRCRSSDPTSKTELRLRSLVVGRVAWEPRKESALIHLETWLGGSWLSCCSMSAWRGRLRSNSLLMTYSLVFLSNPLKIYSALLLQQISYKSPELMTISSLIFRRTTENSSSLDSPLSSSRASRQGSKDTSVLALLGSWFFCLLITGIGGEVLTAGNPLTLKVPRVRGTTLPSGLLHSRWMVAGHLGLNLRLELLGRDYHSTLPSCRTRTTLNSNLVPASGRMYRIWSRRNRSPTPPSAATAPAPGSATTPPAPPASPPPASAPPPSPPPAPKTTAQSYKYYKGVGRSWWVGGGMVSNTGNKLSKVLVVLGLLLLVLEGAQYSLQVALVDGSELVEALAEAGAFVVVDVGVAGDGDAAFLADVDALDEHVLHGALVGLALTHRHGQFQYHSNKLSGTAQHLLAHLDRLLAEFYALHLAPPLRQQLLRVLRVPLLLQLQRQQLLLVEVAALAVQLEALGGGQGQGRVLVHQVLPSQRLLLLKIYRHHRLILVSALLTTIIVCSPLLFLLLHLHHLLPHLQLPLVLLLSLFLSLPLRQSPLHHLLHLPHLFLVLDERRFSRIRCPLILLDVVEEHLDKDEVFPGQFGVDGGLVLLCDAADDLGDGGAVLLHLLVMAAALIGVPGDDHIRHHLIDSHSFLPHRV